MQKPIPTHLDLDDIESSDKDRFTISQRLARFAWVLFVIALGVLANWLGTDPDHWNEWNIGLESQAWIVTALTRIGSILVLEFVVFLGLGFLTAASIAPAYNNASWINFLFWTLVASVLSFAIGTGLWIYAYGQPFVPPSIFSVLWLALACCWGSWLGATWIGSKNSIGWFFRQFVTVILVFGCGSIALLWASLSADRLVASAEKTTSAERRALVEVFKENDPRDLEPEETSEVILSQEEISQLANWGLSLVPGDHASQVDFSTDELTLQATIEIPKVNFEQRYWNLTMIGSPLVRKGEIAFNLSGLELGRIKFPSVLLKNCGPLHIDDEWRNETTDPFFNSLETVAIADDQVAVTYRHLELKDGFVSDALIGLGVVPDVRDATAVQVANLIKLAESNPNLTFSQCLTAAIQTAKERSTDANAADENRAAILGLACVLGHSKIARMVDGNLPTPSKGVQSTFKRVTLRDRGDWTKHFLVSAALHVLANNLVSMDIGVLKEEMDADGGSGFSFGDLLADRSGTMFAEKSTESKSAASDIQDRILQGITDEDLIPSGQDLPEGLTAEQFESRYGGTSGERYRELVDEIDQRIDNLPLYQK